MKKISVFMVLVVLCTLLFTACDKTEGGTTNETQAGTVSTTKEQTTVSTEDQAAADKEAASAKKCIETLILSKDPAEMKKILRNSTDEYIQEIIEGFPADDYVVEVEKLGVYKECVIYFVKLTQASDPEYYYDGIQIFARSGDGLLIELDKTIETDVASKYHCRKCGGSGAAGYDEIQGLEYVCSTCKGKGFVF